MAILKAHHFLVLTGPPEMGKTAIARMLGLALLTEGWEVHECTKPEQIEARFDRSKPQLFIADDAFGSTEYRADAAERWAANLDRILKATDEHHWLVWTSRPAPLRAGLRRLHRERGAERFPQPAAVQVDASALGVEEKTLILFRHARAATWTRAPRPSERSARRSSSTRTSRPSASAASSRAARRWTAARARAERADGGDGGLLPALEREHHEPAAGDARLAARPGGRARPRGGAAPSRLQRVHEGAERPRRPPRRPLPAGDGMRVDWVHPSWRDLVIEELASDADRAAALPVALRRRRRGGRAGLRGWGRRRRASGRC